MANTRSLSNATAERDESMLRRVRHLGSARNGLQEWRLQRRTLLAADLAVRGAAVLLAGASVLAVLKLFLGR